MSETMVHIVKARLNNGREFRIEAGSAAGDEKIASITHQFDEVVETIASLAEAIGSTLEKAKPTKACIEFGIEIGAESGKLTAILVKGTAKANLKISLEWSQPVGR